MQSSTTMPHHTDERTTSGTREAQTRRSWWQRAKDFILTIFTNRPIDMDDDARSHTPKHEINTDTKAVPVEDHPGPSRVLADQPGDAQAVSTRQRPQVPGPKANSNMDSSSTTLEISYSPRSTAQIYFSDMLKPAVGYPVFMPTPSRGLPEAYMKHGIRVGDVGVITSNGAFDFMFNTCQYDDEADEEINPDPLPEDFELLEKHVKVTEKFGPRAVFPGQNVNEVDGYDRPTFQCVGHGGGVLALPTGAVAYEAVNKLDFQHHAARHAISWYKYMLDIGRDYPNGSLYFVTECIKSTSWGIATFYGQRNANNHAGVVFDDESCRWEYRGKLEARVGPSPTHGEPNQCVFVRGYRIMLRRDIWDRLMSAAMGFPYQDGEPTVDISATRSEAINEDGQLIRTHWLGDVILEEDISASFLFHPCDSINTMLLNMKPEAKVAITHDSEWCDHLPQNFTANPFNPDIDGLLENIRQSHEVGIDHESVVLVKRLETDSERQSKGEDAKTRE